MIVPSSELMPLVRASLQRGQHVRMVATGSSMYPCLRDGDQVEIAPLEGEPRRGQVLLVEDGSGGYILHRVVRVRDGQLLLRGDWRGGGEGPFTRNEVLGKVVARHRAGRVRSLESPGARLAGWVWVRGGPLVAGLLSVLRRLRLPGRVLQRLLRLPAVRRYRRRGSSNYRVVEANACDLRLARRGDGSVALPTSQTPDPGATHYVAKSDDEVLGFATLLRAKASELPLEGWWLFGLMVRGRHRGRGIGAALTTHVAAQAQAEGATELLLAVVAENLPAVNLYRKLGFVPVTRDEMAAWLRAQEQVCGKPMLIMAKPLQAGGLEEGTALPAPCRPSDC